MSFLWKQESKLPSLANKELRYLSYLREIAVRRGGSPGTNKTISKDNFISFVITTRHRVEPTCPLISVYSR